MNSKEYSQICDRMINSDMVKAITEELKKNSYDIGESHVLLPYGFDKVQNGYSDVRFIIDRDVSFDCVNQVLSIDCHDRNVDDVIEMFDALSRTELFSKVKEDKCSIRLLNCQRVKIVRKSIKEELQNKFGVTFILD